MFTRFFMQCALIGMHTACTAMTVSEIKFADTTRLQHAKKILETLTFNKTIHTKSRHEENKLVDALTTLQDLYMKTCDSMTKQDAAYLLGEYYFKGYVQTNGSEPYHSSWDIEKAFAYLNFVVDQQSTNVEQQAQAYEILAKIYKVGLPHWLCGWKIPKDSEEAERCTELAKALAAK
jgi:TPR repeat protein